MRTRSIPKPARRPSVLVVQGTPIWIEHADRFWQAEVVNSQRYTSWARFMIGLQLTTIAAFLSGLSYVWVAPSRMGFVEDPIASIGWGIMVFICTMLWRASRIAFVRGLGLMGIVVLCSALVVACVVAVRGGDTFYLSHVLAGWSLGAALIAVSILVFATKILLEPPIKQDEPAIHTASASLRLSQGALKRAKSELSRGEWSSFWRNYEASIRLQSINADFRQTIMRSQRLMVYAVAIILPAIFFTLLAFAFSPFP